MCLWRKICHVEIFSPHNWLSCGNILHTTICQLEKCPHMRKVGFFLFTIHAVLCKISFIVIYAVLAQNQFCCDLLAFAWRKNGTKNCFCREKKDKYQVWVHLFTRLTFFIRLNIFIRLVTFSLSSLVSGTLKGQFSFSWILFWRWMD